MLQTQPPMLEDVNAKLRERPRCPECGAEMRQTRRGATLNKRGRSFVCPEAEAEVTREASGCLKRSAEGRHAYTRAWEEWELECRF
jgi:hypothetical protein